MQYEITSTIALVVIITGVVIFLALLIRHLRTRRIEPRPRPREDATRPHDAPDIAASRATEESYISPVGDKASSAHPIQKNVDREATDSFKDYTDSSSVDDKESE